MNDKKLTLTIEFNSESDAVNQSAIRRTLNADAAYGVLWDVVQEIFRPARKHGYPDPVVERALKECGEMGQELVCLLEQKFHEKLEEAGIDLNDWA